MKLYKQEGALGDYVAPALLALLSTLALCCPICVVQGTETPSFFVSFLSKFVRAFPAPDLTDLVIFPALFVFFRYVSRRCPEKDGWALGLSGLFALLFTLSRSFEELSSIGFFNENKFQLFLALFCTAGFWALFYPPLKLVFKLAAERAPAEAAEPAALKRLWRRGFALIFLCWLPYTLSNYPATFCYDGTWQLRQFFGQTGWTGHHPPLSSAIMGLCVTLGEKIADVNLGCYLYCLLQTLLGALIFSYAVKKLRELGAGRRACVAALLFFALTPMWPAYAQLVEKSLLYTEIALLDFIFLLDIARRRDCTLRDALRVTAATVLASLLRNNGIYEFLPMLVVLAFYLKKAQRRRCLAALLAVLAIYGGVTRALYPALGVEKGSIREALSIPFQQTARYVVTYPEEVTDHEREAIDGVLMYEAMSIYKPAVSDPIKDTYRGDDSKLPEYFKVWLQMLLKKPGVYFSAFYNMCFGTLAPVCSGKGASVIRGVPDYLAGLGVHQVTSDELCQAFTELNVIDRNLPLFKYLSYPGVYTWLLMACAVLLLKRKRFAALIPLIPGVMNVLVCVAAPVHCQDRYSFPLIASMPLILGWTLLRAGRRETEAGAEKEART